MAYTQDGLYFSVSSPLGKDVLLLRAFEGHDALSELFRFDLELESENHDIDFTQIMGKSATIGVELADGSKRWFNGVVSHFLHAGGDSRLSRYRAALRPAFWMMDLTADCRIFQQQTTPQIAETLLGEHGVTFRLELQKSYTQREYCVQYDESAFRFVSRLLEDEGITYFFEHADGAHTLVLTDHGGAFKPPPADATAEVAASTVGVQEKSIIRCTLEQNVIPGRAAVDDFSFETPSSDLDTGVDSKSAIDGSKRRVYEYPAGFAEKGAGEALARLRMEELEVPQHALRGESYCRGFSSGAKFTLAKHARSAANTAYVLRRVVHHGTWTGYTNSFEAFPADIPFRPPRLTRRPRIPGTQTAIVVGKAGEEIWTDEYGRVKVQFHWDQVGTYNEKSSCWIRVAHGWAGKSWGHIFIPRIGHEVVVTFLEGDPDRPLITGSVYNAEMTVPYGLPTDQTKSTIKSDSSKGSGGYNELRYEDKKGQEEVYFQAERDMNRVVKNNDTTKVGFETKSAGDQSIDIYNDRTITIDQGNLKEQTKTGNRTILVDKGNETHTVATGTRDVTVKADETHVNNANFTHTVDGDYSLTIKGKLTIKVTGAISITTDASSTLKASQSITSDAGSSLTAKAGQSLTNQAGTSLTNKSGTSLTNQSGTDLTNKAGTNLTNQASISMTNKASATQTVDGGGMLTLKGGLIKIN
ncbi:MAG: type VI secretion system tip protein TssI/VgrG [Acidobacteriota bacterium]